MFSVHCGDLSTGSAKNMVSFKSSVCERSVHSSDVHAGGANTASLSVAMLQSGHTEVLDSHAHGAASSYFNRQPVGHVVRCSPVPGSMLNPTRELKTLWD